MILSVFILAVVGCLISLYLYVLEKKVRQHPLYKALCDLSDTFSCTKPIKTGYSALVFHISNALIAFFFYMVLVILAINNATVCIKILAIVSCIVSCYLAYLLIFKVKSLCLLCMTLYCINAMVLMISLRL